MTFIKKILHKFSIPFVFFALGFDIIFAKIKSKKFKKNNSDVFTVDRHKLVYKIFKKILWIKRIKVVAKGFENIANKQILFIPNHKSLWDAMVVFVSLYENDLATPLTFVCKKELSEKKSIDAVISLLNGIYLDRSSGRSILACYNRQQLLAKQGYSICVFPEGTRVPSHEFKEFKPAVLKIAYNSGLSIAPICIYGADLKKSKGDNYLHNVYVTMFKPMTPSQFLNIKQEQLMATFKEMIVKEYFSLKEKL